MGTSNQNIQPVVGRDAVKYQAGHDQQGDRFSSLILGIFDALARDNGGTLSGKEKIFLYERTEDGAPDLLPYIGAHPDSNPNPNNYRIIASLSGDPNSQTNVIITLHENFAEGGQGQKIVSVNTLDFGLYSMSAEQSGAQTLTLSLSSPHPPSSSNESRKRNNSMSLDGSDDAMGDMNMNKLAPSPCPTEQITIDNGSSDNDIGMMEDSQQHHSPPCGTFTAMHEITPQISRSNNRWTIVVDLVLDEEGKNKLHGNIRNNKNYLSNKLNEITESMFAKLSVEERKSLHDSMFGADNTLKPAESISKLVNRLSIELPADIPAPTQCVQCKDRPARRSIKTAERTHSAWVTGSKPNTHCFVCSSSSETVSKQFEQRATCADECGRPMLGTHLRCATGDTYGCHPSAELRTCADGCGRQMLGHALRCQQGDTNGCHSPAEPRTCKHGCGRQMKGAYASCRNGRGCKKNN